MMAVRVRCSDVASKQCRRSLRAVLEYFLGGAFLTPWWWGGGEVGNGLVGELGRCWWAVELPYRLRLAELRRSLT